jgi:transposase
MTQKPRKYNQDFKNEAIGLAMRSGSINEVADNLGIPSSTLHGWVKNYGQGTSSIKPGNIDVHEELKRMRKEVSQLKEEREILKKAAQYFARVSK